MRFVYIYIYIKYTHIYILYIYIGHVHLTVVSFLVKFRQFCWPMPHFPRQFFRQNRKIKPKIGFVAYRWYIFICDLSIFPVSLYSGTLFQTKIGFPVARAVLTARFQFAHAHGSFPTGSHFCDKKSVSWGTVIFPVLLAALYSKHKLVSQWLGQF